MKEPTPESKRRARITTAILAAGVLVAGWLVWQSSRDNTPEDASRGKAAQSSGTPPAGQSGSTAAPAAPATPASLKGRWVRTDGGYILDIRDVAPDGKLDTGYFNPRPINVAKAQSSVESGAVKVFVELRDVNYPGSTYTLTLSPDARQLSGVYFQATQRENFDVIFVRE